MTDRRCWKLYFAVMAFLVFASGVCAQKAAPSSPPCTIEAWNSSAPQCELTHLRVENKLQAMKIAYAAYISALQQLSQESERTKEENHWDDTAQFDMNNMRFVIPPQPKKNAAPQAPVPQKETPPPTPQNN